MSKSVEHNRSLVASLIGSLQFGNTEGHARRTEVQRHGYARVRLADLYESFLTLVRLGDPDDSQRFTGLLLQVGEYLDRHADATARVYLMSWSPDTGQRLRVRTLSESGQIESANAFFQGESVPAAGTRQGEVYPGDRAYKSDEELSIQIHMLSVRTEAEANSGIEPVPAIAVWVPVAMGVDTFVQDVPQ